MKRERELLVAVVQADEALVNHGQQCHICEEGDMAACPRAVELVIASASANLEAKIYVDTLLLN